MRTSVRIPSGYRRGATKLEQGFVKEAGQGSRECKKAAGLASSGMNSLQGKEEVKR
jgi:hypothetical protein